MLKHPKHKHAVEQDENEGQGDIEDFATDQNECLKGPILGLLVDLEAKYKEDMKNAKNNFLTDEIRWLISFLRKQLVLEVFKRRISDDDDNELAENELDQFQKNDDICKVLLKLIFDPIIKDMQKLTLRSQFEKILGADR